MEIRNILVNYRALKREIKKANIKSENLEIYMEMLEKSMENLLKREQEDLKYNLENANKNMELLELINKNGNN